MTGDGLELLKLFCTAASVIAPAVAGMIGARRVLVPQICLFPCSNVYLAGIALGITVVVFLAQAISPSTPVRLPHFHMVLWSTWLLVSAGRAATSGSSRQLFQLVEFCYVGYLLVALIVLLGEVPGLRERLLAGLPIGASFLALVMLAAGRIETRQHLIGPNEGSFILVSIGIIPSLYWLLGRGRHRFVAATTVTLALAAMWKMESRGAVSVSFGLMALALAYRLFGRRIGPIVGLGLIVGVAILGTSLLGGFDDIVDRREVRLSFSDRERIAMIEASARLWTEKPLLGWGWGTSDSIFPYIRDTIREYPHPHSTYAQFAVELGLFGLLFLSALYFRPMLMALRRARGQHRAESLLAFLVGAALMLLSLVAVVFYGANRAIVAVLILAIADTGGRAEEREVCDEP